MLDKLLFHIKLDALCHNVLSYHFLLNFVLLNSTLTLLSSEADRDVKYPRSDPGLPGIFLNLVGVIGRYSVFKLQNEYYIYVLICHKIDEVSLNINETKGN